MYRSKIDPTGDSGIAYSWLMIIVFLILGAFAYLCVIMLYNGVIAPANSDIVSGTMSEQTRQALLFNRDFVMAVPILSLIGVFIWSMNRAVGGSGTPYESFYTSWVIFFTMCVVSFLMSFAGGMLIDNLYSNLDEQGYIGDAKIGAVWANAQSSTMFYFINLYYFLCYVIPIVGAGVFFQGLAKNTQGDRYLR